MLIQWGISSFGALNNVNSINWHYHDWYNKFSEENFHQRLLATKTIRQIALDNYNNWASDEDTRRIRNSVVSCNWFLYSVPDGCVCYFENHSYVNFCTVLHIVRKSFCLNDRFWTNRWLHMYVWLSTSSSNFAFRSFVGHGYLEFNYARTDLLYVWPRNES